MIIFAGFVFLLGLISICDGSLNESQQDHLHNGEDRANLSPSECGREMNTSSRIIGGKEAEAHEYPWHVAIADPRWPKSAYCGASLIAPKWVLTAAHCFIDRQWNRIAVKDILVRLGVHHRNSYASQEVQMVPVTMIIHRNYDTANKRNDICLLKLPEKVEYGRTILPVCLPSSDPSSNTNNMYDNVVAIATGHGTVQHGVNKPSSVMHEVSIHTISYEKCSRMPGYYEITDKMLCAAHHSNGKDTCQGDSGGPLITLENDHYVQIGIVSWGYGCGVAKYPGVYTRVSKYLKWIKKNTSPHTSCLYFAKCYRRY